MATKKIRELSNMEKELIKKGNDQVYHYLLAACNDAGYYISKDDWICVPIKFRDSEMFICVNPKPGFVYFETITFTKDKLLSDFLLEIDNSLLPNCEIEFEDSPKVHFNDIEFFENDFGKNYILKMNFKEESYIESFSYWKTGWGSGKTDELESVARIIRDKKYNITDKNINLAEVYTIVKNQFLTKDGFIYGTNKIVLSLNHIHYILWFMLK